MRRKWRPANTGESTNISSVTGLKRSVLPSSASGRSAVPAFQPEGSVSEALTVMALACQPAGYSTTACHCRLSISRVTVMRPPSRLMGARF